MPKNNANAEQEWIEAGYALFAMDGPEGLQVERLARVVNLNKSGFYHYFGDRDSFMERLMVHHAKMGEAVASDLRKVKSLVPDFINVLLAHKQGVIAHMQLVRNREHPVLFQGFNSVNGLVDPFVVPIWAAFTDLAHNLPLAKRHYEMVRDMFYSRITEKNMNYDYLHNLLQEARAVVMELIRKGA